MYVRRKFTQKEREKAEYLSSRLNRLVGDKDSLEPTFDVLAGHLVGFAVSRGMTITEVVETIGWFVQNDSPDGRTSEELIAAFMRGRAS